ncbi:MAG: rRNA maturation RNase YbeY [Rhizobiaceae bacterium]
MPPPSSRNRSPRDAVALDLDIMVEAGDWGDAAAIEALARGAVAAAFAETGHAGAAELSLVLTDDMHVKALNAAWRGKDTATNVLSFPAARVRPGAPLPPLLGDIVIARETVVRESELEGKALDHHLSHLIVHGLLHLLGHDHEDEAGAETMEAIERRALARLAIPDPYAVDENQAPSRDR